MSLPSMVVPSAVELGESLGGDRAGYVAQLRRIRAREPARPPVVYGYESKDIFVEGRMRRLGGITAAGCALALGGLEVLTGTTAQAAAPAAITGAAAAQSAAARPALWRTYDMIVNLQDLPRTYTCDQLWYEVHGILLQLGAWPYSISILPYDFGTKPTDDMTSPNVEVRFQLPFFLTGAAAKSAPAKAIERTIRLAPGAPKTLQPSDCQLMQQISQTMLASILAHVDEQHFDCSGPRRRAADFHVTVTLPVAVESQAARATSAPAPH